MKSICCLLILLFVTGSSYADVNLPMPHLPNPWNSQYTHYDNVNYQFVISSQDPGDTSWPSQCPCSCPCPCLCPCQCYQPCVDDYDNRHTGYLTDTNIEPFSVSFEYDGNQFVVTLPEDAGVKYMLYLSGYDNISDLTESFTSGQNGKPLSSPQYMWGDQTMKYGTINGFNLDGNSSLLFD